MKNLLACLCLFVITASSSAAVLLTDSFNYTNGPLITVSGGSWTTTSGTAGQADVTSSNLNLTSTEGEDVSRMLAGQPYPAAGTTNVFYASFSIRFTSLPTAGGEYFAHFGSTFRARVRSLIGGAASGKFRLGLSSINATINVTNTTDLSLNTPYNIIIRLTNTTGVATLWINATNEADASVTTTETADGSTVTSLVFRQNTSMGTLVVDDVRVATTFAEVIPTNPPAFQPPVIASSPTNQTALPGEPVSLVASVSGSEPLVYQWSFNGTNLAGATSPVLDLAGLDVTNSGSYVLTITNSGGATSSAPALLTVLPLKTPLFSVLDYNLMGNGDPNWTTNNSQVRAIGRILGHLDPDIMTFQEIPATNNGLGQMFNFVAVYRPGFYLVTNSGTDGFLFSVIISRWPITRSQSWLDSVDLAPFGYTNADYTRDLFEAEIPVPGMDQPLHVFTTHLKSGTSASADAQRRAAEASAISNFFATTFLPTNGNRPYLLTGDLNEDITQPAVGSQQPIQKLVNNTTGLRLTTPVNPFNGSHLTHSIRHTNGPANRYDYILPCGLLYSNFAGAQIFRSDLLTNPPAPLLTNDSYTASDHLPVFMKFGNPYLVVAGPFSLTSIQATGSTVTVNWESVSNRVYGVEASTNLVVWTTLATNLTATGTNTSFTTNTVPSQRYLRIFRAP